jgi:glycosyltransferase involved in cell wall biosynthesis
MKNVVLSGPVLTQSGYGTHCRQLAKWLLSKSDLNVKFIITPWGDTPFIIDPKACDGLIGEIMTRTTTVEAVLGFDVSFQLKLPNEWDPKLSRVNVGLSAIVETDCCNPEWVNSCNSMDLVIVPSQHAKKCLENSGKLTKDVLVVPESYTESIDVVESNTILDDFSTSFNFLLFGQLTGNNVHNDRKNVFLTIKWLCEAFKDRKDVGIVIKTNAGRNSKIDRNQIKAMMKQLLSEVRVGQYPKMTLLHGDMSDEEVSSLYKHKQIKALVTLTRGEGFGLPVLEAAASGLPVIATNWSGHLDFLNKGKFVAIQYQLGDIHQTRVDNHIFVKGARWANPSEDDFKRKITKFYDSSATPKEWAKDLQKTIKNEFSFKGICSYYDEALKDII